MPSKEELGGPHDSILLQLGDTEIKIAESYEVKVSVFQQPSAFSLRLGSGSTAADILELARPGTPFKLSVYTGGSPRLIQTGLIDSRHVPSAAQTQVEVRGRDYMAHLFDAYIEEEQDFPQADFLSLTRAVMDKAGLTEAKGHYIQVINDVNRFLLTGVKAKVRGEGTELAQELDTGALAGTGQLVYKTLKAKLGTRYYDFLQQQFKLAGLFLWASPDKTFVLARPLAKQDASFFLRRSRTSGQTNIIDCSFSDDTTMRHSKAIVYGKSGGGKRGVEICRGEFVDPEMQNYGFDKNIVVHDADVKTQAECEYVARRILSEQRRNGWKLDYTVSGHIVPSQNSYTGVAVWGPDTIVNVSDEEMHVDGDDSLNFKTNFYLEAVTYSRSPHTHTKLHLVRPGDLLYAHGLQEDGTIIKRKLHQKKPRIAR